MDSYIPLSNKTYLRREGGEVLKVRVIKTNGKTQTAIVETPEGILEEVALDNLYTSKEMAENAKEEQSNPLEAILSVQRRK